MYKMSHHCYENLPFLADIPEQNVIFVICASESESSRLCLLKELLIKTLFSLASKPTEAMFSVLGCANKVLRWQSNLVRCSLTTVTEAAAWIRTLELTGRASVLSAMVTALEDLAYQAVYLFTSGFPEYTAKEICNHLVETEQPCAVHFVYLAGMKERDKKSSLILLERAAEKSGGSFQEIHLNSKGVSDEDNSGCPTDLSSSNHIRKTDCTPLLSGHYTSTQQPLCSWSLHSPKIFRKTSVKESFVDWSPEIENLQRGIRVLARRETDGYYYLGHLVQKVKGSRELFLIEFEKSQHSRKDKTQFRMQETPLYDVIHFEDGIWQPLAAGDRVLAPWEKKAERYGPGIVLQVKESGLSQSAIRNSEVLVNFWNGHTKSLPADVAVRIPLPLSERIVLEFQMPLAARQMLVEQNPDYPYIVPPGYRASGPCRGNHWQDPLQVHCVCTTCNSGHLPFSNSCFSASELFRSPVCTMKPDEALIPGSNLTMDELDRKTDEQLSKGQHSISERKEEDENRMIKEERKLAENTDTKPSKDYQQEKASRGLREGAGTTIDAATNTDKCTIDQKQKIFLQPSMSRPSSQLCPRLSSQKASAGNTSQLQAIFEGVSRSVKKDCISMEPILPMRKSYSVPSLQSSVTKEEPQDGGTKTDINTARIEFKRQKWKQRQLKEEQQRKEEELKRELRFDRKRERSFQRTLQSSQKENCDNKAGRCVAQLQTAKAERKRQELYLQYVERSKEHQRLEFLKAQCRKREKQLAERNQGIDDQEKERLALLQKRRKSMQKKFEVTMEEENLQKKEKEAAKCKVFHKREQLSQHMEKERHKHDDLQKYVQEQSLLMLRATLLP